MRTPGPIRLRPGLLAAGGAVVAGLYVLLSHALASAVPETDAAAAQRSTPAAGPRDVVGHDPRTTVLQHRVAALESDLTALRSERTAQPRDPQARAIDPPVPPRLDANEQQSQRDQQETRIFAEIGRGFRAQPVDPAWSTATTDRIADHLRARPLDRSSVEKIECRSSVCRIDLDVEPGADLAAIRDGLRVALVDVTGSGASMRDETGRFVIYLAKDPRDLGAATQPAAP
jgi:hypothetical protein